MRFPNNGLRISVDRIDIIFPVEACGIGSSEIQHHTAIAVDTRAARVGIDRFLHARGGFHRVRVVLARYVVRIAAPHAPVSENHIYVIVRRTAVARFVQIKHYVFCRGRPHLEGCGMPVYNCAQFTVVIVAVAEAFAVKHFVRERFHFAEARNFHRINLIQIHFLTQTNGASFGSFVFSQQRRNRHLLSVAVYLYIRLARKLGCRNDGKTNLVKLAYCNLFYLFNHSKRLPAVVTFEFIRINACKINFRNIARQGYCTVVIVYFIGNAPSFSVRSSVFTQNKTDLLDLLRNVDNRFCPVRAGVKFVRASFGKVVPQPQVVILVGMRRFTPIYDQLTAAFFAGQFVIFQYARIYADIHVDFVLACVEIIVLRITRRQAQRQC